MEVKLSKKPRNPIIIEGFPGLGFVGTIAVEFLIEHLNAKLIGRIESKKLMPLAAIHKEVVVEPLGIYYSSKENIVLVHALGNINGLEWDLADAVVELSKQLKAKEVISLEGVSSPDTQTKELKTYFYTTRAKSKLPKLGFQPLKEGVIVGVSGALLLKDKLPMSCVFSETKTGLPDSRAAANIVQALDKYLGLKVDYQPLLKKADEFESKLKGLMEKTKTATDQKERKELDYFG